MRRSPEFSTWSKWLKQSSVTTLFCTTVLTGMLLVAPTVQAAGSSDDDENAATTDLKLVERLIYKEKYKKAVGRLEKIVKQDKKNADAWNLLGFASRNLGDVETATTAYETALSLNSEHLGALEYQGELYISIGKMAKAQSNLDRLNELCPDGCEEQQALKRALANTN